MNIYLKNQKDKLDFCVARCANEEACNEVIADMFDVIEINEQQHLLILKELGHPDPAQRRKFFIGVFETQKETIKYMNSMIDVRMEKKNED